MNITANPTQGISFQCVMSHAKDKDWEAKYKLMANIALSMIKAHQGNRDEMIRKHADSGKNDAMVG